MLMLTWMLEPPDPDPPCFVGFSSDFYVDPVWKGEKKKYGAPQGIIGESLFNVCVLVPEISPTLHLHCTAYLPRLAATRAGVHVNTSTEIDFGWWG